MAILNRPVESARQTDTPLVRVMASGLAHRNDTAKALEVAAQREVPVLKEERLTILDTIITLAPLLGLLGTVTGILSAPSASCRRLALANLTPSPAASPKR